MSKLREKIREIYKFENMEINKDVIEQIYLMSSGLKAEVQSRRRVSRILFVISLMPFLIIMAEIDIPVMLYFFDDVSDVYVNEFNERILLIVSVIVLITCFFVKKIIFAAMDKRESETVIKDDINTLEKFYCIENNLLYCIKLRFSYASAVHFLWFISFLIPGICQYLNAVGGWLETLGLGFLIFLITECILLSLITRISGYGTETNCPVRPELLIGIIDRIKDEGLKYGYKPGKECEKIRKQEMEEMRKWREERNRAESYDTGSSNSRMHDDLDALHRSLYRQHPDEWSAPLPPWKDY